jgi:hypothetical protein
MATGAGNKDREWDDWDEAGAGIGSFMINLIIKELSTDGLLHIPYPLAKKVFQHTMSMSKDNQKYVKTLPKVCRASKPGIMCYGILIQEPV